MSGINGGHILTTGFAHKALGDSAPEVIDAIKSGAVKHIFLVGGCDGAHPGRNYYTDFVKSTPMDSLILTLACGKFRLNDLDLGDINGIPRILDAGQCNDAYSAVQIALALADAFGCGVNDLPLTLVLSWYEQKAVCILLTWASSAFTWGPPCRPSCQRRWSRRWWIPISCSPSPIPNRIWTPYCTADKETSPGGAGGCFFIQAPLPGRPIPA